MKAGDGLVSTSDNLPYILLTYAIEVAQEHSCDVKPYLEQAGLTNCVMQDGETEVFRRQYYDFIQGLLGQYSIPAFGLKVGQKFSIADYGVLGYATISCSTLIQALQTFFRFQQIVGSDASFSEEMRIEDGFAIIRINSPQASEPLYRFEVEEAIGQWSVSEMILENGHSMAFSKVHFSFPKPEYHALLKEKLGCPVHFGKKASEIFISETLLNQRFSMANEITSQLCEQQCEKILQGLQQQAGLVEQVRRLIINQPGEVPDPDKVASYFNVSYRTLRRRLRDEGTSFKDIHNEVRMEMAMDYLRQTELTTQGIAYMLGFSEVTNFHRAFKKWQGCTPGEFRESARIV